MDASSNTAAITQAALQDVTRFLDRTEENLRSLAVNPYIKTKHDEEAMLLSGNISLMTQGVEDDIPVSVRIPHRCAVNREYRSRPRRRQLDWIISTNPLHVQPITATELDSEFRGVLRDQIFDTSTGKWRRRNLGKKKSKDVLLEPLSAPSPTVEGNVMTATESESEFPGAPGEPRIFDKNTGKWRRRILGKKKSKDAPLGPPPAPASTVEENAVAATELDTGSRGAPSPAPPLTVEENVMTATGSESEFPGAPGEPRIFDKSTGKWRRRNLGKKKSKTVLLEPLSAPSPTAEENGSKPTTGFTSNSNEFLPNSSQNEKIETKKKAVTPPSSRDPMFIQSPSVSNQYKTDVEAALLKTAQELEQAGLKALSEIELSKSAWREKINVGLGSHAKVVDVSTGSSEGIGEKERLNAAQPLTASNSLASEKQMQQAQASSKKRLRRPSLAEVEIQRDLNSDDFVSPKSSKISDLTQASLLTSHADDEESKKTKMRKSDIKSEDTPHRRRRLPRPFQSDVSMLGNKNRSKARLRMRAKAARIRERKRLSRAANDADECCCSPRLKPLRNILDDSNRIIQLEPLKAPISVDSSSTITRCAEQINLTQILRIYGSGNVEEPYDVMPQRLARTIRGALANVLCGTNMIEIRLINTAIHSARRGQVNNWIFTHDEDVHTTPIVFAKTVLLQDHPPAPFCLSIASPFWVSIYQEQVASSKGGERFRDCIEVRSCKGSDMPCFEMSPLQSQVHPSFKERIYLGKGVIRIERNVELPSERESSEWFSNSTLISTQRQYRIQLPWRQREGQPETGIPRAPQVTEIRTTNHPHISIPNEQQNKPYRRTRPQKARTTSSSAITSPITSTSSYFSDNASNSSEAWLAPKKEGFSRMNELSTAIQKGYKEPPVLKSPQDLYSGAVRSKRSLQITDELSQGDTLPISPTQESMEEVSHDLPSSPTQDSVEEASETTYAGEEVGETATSPMSTDTSAGTTSSLGYFEYGVELEGTQNDIVTAVALPPVLLHIRRRKGDPLRNIGSVSYKYVASKKKSKSSKLHSRSSSAGISKIESENKRHLVDELADSLYAGDVVVHEKLADDTLKLQLHITSKIKDAIKEEKDADRFLPDRITVQGKDVWTGI